MSLKSRLFEHEICSTLEAGIIKGSIEFITPEGKSYRYEGREPGAHGVWKFNSWDVVPAMASRGDIGMGESYINGEWDTPDLDALFTVFIDNLDNFDKHANGHKFMRFWFSLLNNIIRRNSIKGSRQNIRAHYDVGNPFYRLWLDPTMTYSSALYENGSETLETAQRNKYQRMLNKIQADRKNILEIGCGWGGFAEQATANGHHVTGITISNEQHQFAKERLQNKSADIRLQDYRQLNGTFDAIASIEMFEAVGKRYWPEYFNTLKRSLSDDGVAMIQTITVRDEKFDSYARQGDYIRQYVFPGGLLPSMEQFKNHAERAGLMCKEAFGFGQDYARTLREWTQRFNASEPSIRSLGYDEKFIRSWKLYLNMCAASFGCGQTNVIQVELHHA